MTTTKIKSITIQDGDYSLNLEIVESVIWDHINQSADAKTISGDVFTFESEDYHKLIKGLKSQGWDI
jgi:hypothetical protein